mmetsp:Transcript_18817/g.66495  ORF Transcript_18817/g.66495 Transcript_18817/m.66495 type:complete len:285 (-) Transcript_18817:88-942(-)
MPTSSVLPSSAMRRSAPAAAGTLTIVAPVRRCVTITVEPGSTAKRMTASRPEPRSSVTCTYASTPPKAAARYPITVTPASSPRARNDTVASGADADRAAAIASRCARGLMRPPPRRPWYSWPSHTVMILAPRSPRSMRAAMATAVVMYVRPPRLSSTYSIAHAMLSIVTSWQPRSATSSGLTSSTTLPASSHVVSSRASRAAMSMSVTSWLYVISVILMPRLAANISRRPSDPRSTSLSTLRIEPDTSSSTTMGASSASAAPHGATRNTPSSPRTTRSAMMAPQ